MTSQPRPLSAFLYSRGINARPITWPTVPKGKDRVRLCLHAGNTREEVDRLLDTMVEWAEMTSAGVVRERKQVVKGEPDIVARPLVQSKL